MRSGFGKAAQKMRAERGMTQTDFAEQTGWSLSRISNIEFQRSAISDDVLRKYLKVLKTTGEEADRLRKLARFSNDVRMEEKASSELPAMVALLRQFGDKLSPTALAQIEKIVERETGEQVASLTFASNQSASKNGKKSKRATLTLTRFVEICILASRFRSRFESETHKINLEGVLERLAAEDDRFDYRISEALPTIAAGAFAVIIGERSGATLFLEQQRFINMVRGVHFCRHVVAHEIGHYVLHSSLLESDSEIFFSPQSLAKNSPNIIGSERQIEQVVDTVEEAEAECFATFFLVPWEVMLRGTKLDYLSSDFGEQKSEIDRYMGFFKQDAVFREFKRQLWKAGEKTHPIFHNS